MDKTPIIALDTETTGLSPVRDKIVEVAAVKYVGDVEVEVFHTLINPLRDIPWQVQRVHGISNVMVADSPTFCEIAEELAEFLQGGSLLGHNVMFDYGFISHECAGAKVEFSNDFPMLDTYQIAKMRLPMLPSYRLVALKELLGIGVGQTHRALDDVRDCKNVYDILMSTDEIELCPQNANPLLPPELQPLFDAMLNQTDVVIEYRDMNNRVTERYIRPISIYGDVLKAYCHLRGDERHFKLSRVILKRSQTFRKSLNKT